MSKQSKDSKNPKRRKFLKDSLKTLALASLASGALTPLQARQNSTFKGDKMQLTKNARAMATTLFGDIDNVQLAKSDKEFLENYINFAFGEVIEESGILSLQERLKLALGSLVAVQGKSEFQNICKAALNNDVSAVEIKEIVYQTTPYIGIGKSLEFILLTNAIFKELGVKTETEERSTTTQETRESKGLEVQKKYFGEDIIQQNRNAPAEVKHIRRFLSANCFGDYYTRKGLDLAFRELLTFVILISLGGAEPQVKAHIQGNLNIGNSRQKLIATITSLIPYIGYPRALNALSAL